MSQDQDDTIFVQISQKVHDLMIEESAAWPGKETGGMMFGKISETHTSLEIKILKTIIPKPDVCLRSSISFEINPNHAKKVVENEKLKYLGNWHKHLGYGGPSYGDLKQIEDFFNGNPHLNLVVTYIVDFNSNNDYVSIIEVYKRINSIITQEEKIYDTYRVPPNNISVFDEESLKIVRGITKDKLDIIKKELVIANDFKFSLEEINVFSGQTIDEKILSFPFKFYIEAKGEKMDLDLLILISFPSNFPDGEIFIDISSQDLSRNITFEKHPAELLNNTDLIGPFLTSLKASLEDEVPILLMKPLWKVMHSLK